MRRFLIFCVFCILCGSTYGANEINAFAPGVTTAYAIVRQTDGDVWYVIGQVFEVWGTGARTAADYDIALTDKAGDMFVGNFDTNVAAGVYHVVTHYQVGGSPANSDPAVWQEHGYWDGAIWGSDVVAALPTKEEIRAEIDANSTQLAAILADTNELQTDWTNGGRLDLLIDGIKAVTDIMELKNTTVSAADDSNSFTITAGLAVADAYRGLTIYVKDATDGNWDAQMIAEYTAGRVVTVDADFSFTPDVGDIVIIWGLTAYPVDVFDGLPMPPKPDTITVDLRAGTTGGGTTTLNEFSDDP